MPKNVGKFPFSVYNFVYLEGVIFLCVYPSFTAFVCYFSLFCCLVLFLLLPVQFHPTFAQKSAQKRSCTLRAKSFHTKCHAASARRKPMRGEVGCFERNRVREWKYDPRVYVLQAVFCVR